MSGDGDIHPRCSNRTFTTVDVNTRRPASRKMRKRRPWLFPRKPDDSAVHGTVRYSGRP